MAAADHARQRARNLLTVGRLDAARSAIGDVLAANPSDARAIRLLAEIELAAGELGAARDHASTAVGLLPEGRSFLVLSSVERRAGDYAAAVAACEQGLAREPENAPLHVSLSLAWSGPWLNDRSSVISEQRRRAVGQARDAAQRALELDPEHALAHYASAAAHLSANDPFAAAKALDAGLELRPDWQDGHLLMSAVRARQGMVKLASRHLATAGRLDPSHDEPIERLRRLRGRRRFRRNTPAPTPWWLDADAREVLRADDRLGGR